MNVFDFENLREACLGRWLTQPEPGAVATGLSTDTRTIKAGKAFLAIAGPTYDAHEHLHDAAARGASCLIVEREVTGVGVPMLLVPSTRAALCMIARSHRRSLDGTTVIAVTGSNGKTTTVRLIASVLAQAGSVHSSPKSFNNDIGVPLTILGCSSGTRFLICEVGTNAPGEIAPLAEIIEPDIAAITSIGRAHLEALGSIEGVAQEKANIFASMRSADGTRLVPGDSELLTHVPGVTPVSADNIEPSHDGTSFEISGSRFHVPLLGAHNAHNAAFAIAIGRQVGMDDDAIQRGLSAVAPPEHRLAVRTHAGITVMNDAYNANPDSMRAALRVFADLSGGASRRVIVIGQMGELGEHSEAAHRALAREIAEIVPPERLITVGAEARATHEEATTALPGTAREHFDTLSDSDAAGIARSLRSGDALLLKGSRTNALERIDDALDNTQPAPCSTA